MQGKRMHLSPFYTDRMSSSLFTFDCLLLPGGELTSFVPSTSSNNFSVSRKTVDRQRMCPTLRRPKANPRQNSELHLRHVLPGNQCLLKVVLSSN